MLLDQQTNPFTFTVSRQRRKHLVDVVLVVAVVILILHSTPLPSSAPPANLPKPKPIGKSQKMRSMERDGEIDICLICLHRPRLLCNWTEDETNEVFRENQFDGLEDPSIPSLRDSLRHQLCRPQTYPGSPA